MAVASGSSGKQRVLPMALLTDCMLPEEKLNSTPSEADGISKNTEKQLRAAGCVLIQIAGKHLLLMQGDIAVAQILFQRFYYFKSFVQHDIEITATACLLLAAKSSPQTSRGDFMCEHFIGAIHKAKHRHSGGFYQPLVMKDYIDTKQKVFTAEQYVLRALGFWIFMELPHKVFWATIVPSDSILNHSFTRMIIQEYFSEITMYTDPKFQEMVWENLNDTIKSETIFRFPSKTIAGACIYLSACLVNVSLQMCSDREWLLFFEHHQEDIEAINMHLIAFRDRPTPQENLDELKRMVEYANIAHTLFGYEKKLKENLASVVDQMRPPHSNSSAENNPPNPDGQENKPKMKKSGIKSKANRDTKQQKRKRISPGANGMNKSHRKKSKISSSGEILSSHAPSSSKHPPEVSRIFTSQHQGSKVKVIRNDEIQMLKLEYEEES